MPTTFFTPSPGPFPSKLGKGSYTRRDVRHFASAGKWVARLSDITRTGDLIVRPYKILRTYRLTNCRSR